MNINRFGEHVLQLKPTMSVSQGFFFYQPAEHVLSGFTLDARPNGGQIYAFTMPLFDRIEAISLSFAERLPPPQCFIEMEGKVAELAKAFVQRISRHELEVLGWASIEAFVARITTRRGALHNPWVRRAYGMALLMLRRDSEALEHLTAALGVKATKRYPGFHEDVSSVIRDIESGEEQAREKLLRWESETKKRFGIASFPAAPPS